MNFVCKRCRFKSHKHTDRELICVSCNDQLNLLEKQLEVNKTRIRKLEEHKKSVKHKLKNLNSKKDYENLMETIKRLDRNLNDEYSKCDGIIKAILSNETF